jgi:hypothetical protein
VTAPGGAGRTYRPATVRFYIDADVLGLAKLMTRVRNDVTYPGDVGGDLHKRRRPPCIITSPQTKDTDWIPAVAAEGWLIITRDTHIGVHRAEIEAVRRHGAKMVALSGKDAGGTFEQLELLMIQWRNIERVASEPGPFIYRATRTTFRNVPLE